MQDTSSVLELERVASRAGVMHEIHRELSPYRIEEKPITGQTAIYRELSVDSLVVMDIVLELEDRFDISIPIDVVAEIHTVAELTDAILALQERRKAA